MDAEAVTEVTSKPKKAKRHRKKGLIKALQQQLEFYFGDVNLSKDRFLSQLIQQDPCKLDSDVFSRIVNHVNLDVNLEVLLQFNKIKQISTDIKELQKAISNSTLLKLSEDETKVCRISPVQVKENADECTIYVEGLSKTATHEGVQSLFFDFGKVVYVSLPKYRISRQIKGFAFVEFDTPDAAVKAVQAYKASGNYISSDHNPAELRSVKTFETGDGEKNSEKQIISSGNGESADEEDGEKEMKADGDQLEHPRETVKRERQSGSESDENAPSEKKLKVDTESPETKQKKKKKRNRIKKTKETEEAQSLTLRILSKVDWKRMRNAYLDMQRKNMRQAKENWKNFKAKGGPQFEKKVTQTEVPMKEEPTENKADQKEFHPGVIVKLELAEPVSDVKRFKAQVKMHKGVAYVDAKECSTECFVRCESKEAALKLHSDGVWPNSSILTGDDEVSYWDKISADRTLKKSKTVRSKERGIEKLKRKTAKLEKEQRIHTFFDDNE